MNRKLGQQRLKAAEQVVAFCKRMVDDGLTHATGGNISVRVSGTEEFAVSPSAVEYRLMSVEDVPIVDAAGTPVAPARYGHTPSSELGMHLAAYRARRTRQRSLAWKSPYLRSIIWCARRVKMFRVSRTIRLEARNSRRLPQRRSMSGIARCS